MQRGRRVPLRRRRVRGGEEIERFLVVAVAKADVTAAEEVSGGVTNSGGNSPQEEVRVGIAGSSSSGNHHATLLSIPLAAYAFHQHQTLPGGHQTQHK